MTGDVVEEWLRLGGYTHRDAAEVLGVDHPRIHKWLYGRAYPNKMHAAMIKQDMAALRKEKETYGGQDIDPE